MTVSFRTPPALSGPLTGVDEMRHERLRQSLESRTAQQFHQLEMQLIDLKHQVEMAHIQLELRTWLILAAIPTSAVMLALVLTGLLRRASR